MSRDDLSSLLETLAEEVDHMPQREYSAPAWRRAQRLRRRRTVLAAVAAAVLLTVPVALVLTRGEPPGRPADPVYSDMPMRPLAGHTATVLTDGRLLIVGGCGTDGCGSAEVRPTSEFYVPGHGFAAGPELLQPRQGHTATLLADGRVLIAGGWAREGTPPLQSTEVYRPDLGRFSPAGALSLGRGGHTATTLTDGRVLIAGGQSGAHGSTATAELFDPATNTFTPAAAMPVPRDAAVATLLADGRVLVVGGQDSDGNALSSALLYDPGSDTWQPTGSLATARNKAAIAPLPDGRVMVLGGTPDDRQILQSTEIYDPGNGTFSPGPSMDVARYKFTAAVLAGDRLVVAGGTQLSVYDGGTFRPLANTAGPIRWAPTVTALPGGDVLIVGGYDDRIRLYADAQLVPAAQLS